MASKTNLVWIDMEMSGLDPDTDTVLEIATIITDKDLNIIAYGPEIVIGQDPSLYATMDDWNKEHHSKSGLWEKVLESKVSIQQAETQTLEFIQEHCHKACTLAGNSIWQDRRFIINYMPKLDTYMHYRMIDVSSIKILTTLYRKDLRFKKQNNHRALDDIKESIYELQYYKENFLNLKK